MFSWCLLQCTSTDEPIRALPAISQLAQNANRRRQKLRPEEPFDLKFVLAEDFIPNDFLQKDITVDDRRHIIFATPLMLRILSQAKNWYIDGTLKTTSPDGIVDFLNSNS